MTLTSDNCPNPMGYSWGLGHYHTIMKLSGGDTNAKIGLPRRCTGPEQKMTEKTKRSHQPLKAVRTTSL